MNPAQEAAIALICGELDIETWNSYSACSTILFGPQDESRQSDQHHAGGALAVEQYRDSTVPSSRISNVKTLPTYHAMSSAATSRIQNQQPHGHGVPKHHEAHQRTTTTRNTNSGAAATRTDKSITDNDMSVGITMKKQTMRKKAVQKRPRKTKSFIQRVAELAEFKKRHGHCDVPPQSSLGRWCKLMRFDYASVKKEKLSKRKFESAMERIAILEGMGFLWCRGVKKFKSFEEYLLELKEFKAKYGHCNVTGEYPSLRSWCYRMRRFYKGKKGGQDIPMKLEQQVKKLEAMDFQWSVKKTFQERLDDLAKFKEIHGHCNVPRKTPSLGIWCNRVRVAYRSQKRGRPLPNFFLSEEQTKKLEDMGFKFCCYNIPI